MGRLLLFLTDSVEVTSCRWTLLKSSVLARPARVQDRHGTERSEMRKSKTAYKQIEKEKRERERE